MFEYTDAENAAMLVEIERTRARIAEVAAAKMPQYGPLSFDPLTPKVDAPRATLRARFRRLVDHLRAQSFNAAMIVWE